MINRETIWKETYKSKGFRIDATTDIAVLTAIHHNQSTQQLDLVAELQIEFCSEGGRFFNKTYLNPEQMETLAKHLQQAAEAQRRLITLMEADKADKQAEAA